MFSSCKYYEESVKNKNCPLSCVCKEDCYFTLKELDQEFNILQEENYDLTEKLSQIYDNEEELNELQDEVNDLQDENSKLEEENMELIHIIISILNDLKLDFSDVEEYLNGLSNSKTYEYIKIKSKL